MLEADSAEICSYHACCRPDCTRVFRVSIGYLDRIEGEFDVSRSSAQRCPRCGSALFLADVDHSRKFETWECPQPDCGYAEGHSSPSAR